MFLQQQFSHNTPWRFIDEQIAEKELAPLEEETVETKVFHWNIENYKDLPERVQGPVFEVGGHKW